MKFEIIIAFGLDSDLKRKYMKPNPYRTEKVVLSAVASTNENWLSKRNLTILPLLANLWTSWGPRRRVPKTLVARFVS